MKRNRRSYLELSEEEKKNRAQRTRDLRSQEKKKLKAIKTEFQTRFLEAKKKKNESKPVSRYKGVFWSMKKGKWMVRLKHRGVNYYLGYYNSENVAARHYNYKALQLFGDNPKFLNKLEDDWRARIKE